jgi:hypothetical protein
MQISPFHALYTARELSAYAYANSAERLAVAYASPDIEVFQ